MLRRCLRLLRTACPCLVLLGLDGAPALSADAPPAERWRFLQNEHLNVGIDLHAGASIGWLSAATAPDTNLLNTYDTGRYVQQSYYGDPDGSDWNGTPWRYNPVQGGGWRGDPAKLLELREGKDESGTAFLFARTQPRHWATGQLLPEVVMEQTVSLKGPLVQVKYLLVYNGTITHKPHHQEVPAFFVQPTHDTLVFCEKGHWEQQPLTRRQPGPKNEYVKPTEPWIAWENPSGLAVGVLSPGIDLVTCYRVPGPAACSYAAPLQTFALTPALRFEYVAFLGIGSVTDLRSRFQQAAKAP